MTPGAAVLAVVMLLVSLVLGGPTPSRAVAPTGQGFILTPADLAFILKQIKISERHSFSRTPTNPCGTLVGTGAYQVPDVLTPYGLRTVDGSCNNLIPGRENFATSLQLFPRLTTPVFNAADPVPASFGGDGITPTSYTQTNGLVVDSQPRTISNLIVDQSSANPAAVAAANFPVRTQGNPGLGVCSDPPNPNVDQIGCTTLNHQTLFIPNVTTDVGLSPPYNSLFTIFGQFFDHGVDKINNGGNGTVAVPLNADDPLVLFGPDGIAANGDEVPAGTPLFLTRGSMQPGPDGLKGTADDIHETVNSDSPWVDLSQDYTSHPSHQIFLREYAMDANIHPRATGKFLGNADGAMANWGDVKAQTAAKLGLQLVDTDVNNIPMVLADPYGEFIPGANGLPQWVTTTGALVPGDLNAPVAAPANVARLSIAFLNDIAHPAAPTKSNGTPLTPDADLVPGTPSAVPAPGEYDDELLALHVIAGDGRANENIGLTSIHTVFEHEHNRLVDHIKDVLTNDTSVDGTAALAQWQLPFADADPPNPSLDASATADGWNGDRLFQAARFATEMQYQHLVFEEFARKVQPLIDPFHVYHTEINAATFAEFAHAVYRFGHSMLDDTVPRLHVDGSTNDIALLDAFLNPAAFKDVSSADLAETASGNDMGGAGAGDIIMGLSDQVGNELDEFINNTLRNNLLGLPLDLAVLNMARARSEGVPPLNQLRRQIFAKGNDGSMQPYANWVDFGLQIKHPESLVNFVAAYGHHPTITAETTLAGKRAAAQLIVDPQIGQTPPADAYDFMNGTGAWADSGGMTSTGLDDVDLWMGGLAERVNLFGGLLGSTFNYVFEQQLTNLQNGDRFYYLNRTPGLNLRAQLEGNSFAELVMRNTNAHTLKADAFGTADCKFEIGNLQFGTGNLVLDDPASECDESKLLIHLADGTIQYRTTNTVDPPGLNGQGVYNGTPAADRIKGGVDNDTILGNDGNDVLQGNDGDDIVLGGNGNDIITDIAGADVPKGGPGNDAIDAGPGIDIVMGGTGADFTNGGLNDNETFAGEGNDFVIAGNGADAVFGGSGDDWIEGGNGQDLLQGDSGAFFFDDPDQPGNDVLVGQPGENDYDSEGGDDIMMTYPAIDRSAAAGGWDWVSGQYDTTPMDADLTLKLVGIPLNQVVNRDRYQEIEGVSGTSFDDKINGDSTVPALVAGGGFTGCDALDQTGVDRIAGLAPLVPPFNTTAAVLKAATAAHHCPLVGPAWGDGEIMLGGAGSDTFTGNGGSDVIDGDKYLHVRISYRSDPTNAATEIGTTELMEGLPTAGGWGPGTTGMTLQQAVFAGKVDPGNLVIVREIFTAPASAAIDTAVFTGPFAGYTITHNVDGSVTVADGRGAAAAPGTGSDNTDTLWNIERLQFTDVTISLVNHPATGVPTISSNAPVVGTLLTASTVGIADPDGIVGVTFNFQWLADGVAIPGATSSTFAPTAAQVGKALTVVVSFTDNSGFAESVTSAPTGPVVAPAVPTISVVAPGALTTPGSLVRAVGAPASAQSVTVTNTGTANLVVSSVTVTGTNAASFVAANGCGTVTPGSTCAITVNFTATAPASVAGVAKTATLTIASNAVGSPTVVSLNGTAVTNSPPTGTPTVDDQTPTEGSALNGGTAAIADADGLGVFSYQWQQNNLGGGGAFTNIAGVAATAASFTPLQGQVTRRVRVVVTFVDGHGTTQTVTSAQTTSVVGDLFPGIGNDNSGADILAGTAGDDFYSGGLDADSITTGAGNDIASGDEGDDAINTGAGNDEIRYGTPSGLGNGFDAVNAGANVDTIVATGNGAVIGLSSVAGVENINAGVFTGVTIQGSAANNTLNFGAVTLTGIAYIDGGAGVDTITGSAGDDVIIGGAGNDTMTGGPGADTFRFFAGFGADRINGFVVGTDKLDISGLGITAATFAASVTITNGGGGSTLITIGGQTIRLLGVAPATVNIGSFVLAP